MIKTFQYGIKSICSQDAVEEETKALGITPKESGYLKKFMNKHLAMKRERSPNCEQNVSVYTSLVYR